MWDRELARYIEHTNLKPEATEADIQRLCQEAKTYGFKCAIVSPYYVPFALSQLRGSDVCLGSVVSFPLGAHHPDAKVREAEDLITRGAQEIDMVMNIGAFLSGRWSVVEEEVRLVSSICKGRVILKVILETAYLDRSGIERATEIVSCSGADFAKTSTGLAPQGASAENVRIMRAVAGDRLGIKAAGGIRTRAFALELIEAGASRLGCSESIGVVTLEAARG